ncbi:hypothetical protein [Mycoplasma procyoni]|uniref:hypothetical protein n=1 Tax=Mycoplasma procyoni TaxID=568784 RepID=UPI00197BAE17|nr:hypothetical protein [Mycoplasma procyoni]MBN3534687.1 hypothetical protein [Mycoplasma procyoni]
MYYKKDLKRVNSKMRSLFTLLLIQLAISFALWVIKIVKWPAQNLFNITDKLSSGIFWISIALIILLLLSAFGVISTTIVAYKKYKGLKLNDPYFKQSESFAKLKTIWFLSVVLVFVAIILDFIPYVGFWLDLASLILVFYTLTKTTKQIKPEIKNPSRKPIKQK